MKACLFDVAFLLCLNRLRRDECRRALAAAHAYHQVVIVFPSAYLALLFLLLGEGDRPFELMLTLTRLLYTYKRWTFESLLHFMDSGPLFVVRAWCF